MQSNRGRGWDGVGGWGGMGRQTTAVGLTRLRTPSCTGVSVGGVVGSVAQWMDGSVMVLDGWMGGCVGGDGVRWVDTGACRYVPFSNES